MTYSFNFRIVFFSLLTIVLLSSCTKEEETDTLENSLVNVNLKGTETLLNSLNLELLDVQLRVSEDLSNPNAWISLNTINTGVHDLTNYIGNTSIALVEFEEVPSEFIYNIKLVFGEDNAVVKDHVEYLLNIESEYTNASVNVIEKQLVENKLYEFTIQLNIDESIHFDSPNTVKLEPKTSTLMRRYNLF